MSKTKRMLLLILIAFILLIGIFTAVLDFSRLSGQWSFYQSYPVEYLKRINVILAAVIVLLAGKDRLSQQDNMRMMVIFAVICSGEIFFLAAKPALAIGCFALCQLLLTARHCKGIQAGLSCAGLPQKLCLALTALALLLLYAYATASLYAFSTSYSLFVAGKIYGIILCISLWAGLTNRVLLLYPKRNASMIAVGMACFFCCDVLVGLDGLLQSGRLWLVATSLIWVFYTPAIALLALSCYRYGTNIRIQASMQSIKK